MANTSIKNGVPAYDTNGNRIQTHGGSVYYDGGKFWWYGENKEFTTSAYTAIRHNGVRMYSSDDLYNWTDEGVVCKPSEDPSNPLHNTRFVERPHIIYNKKTAKYVMWSKLVGNNENKGDWNCQYYGIATSDRINGEYTLVNTLHPCQMNAGDFDLYVNPSDGKAYIYFERVHTELICADLTEDYLGVTGYYSSHFPYGYPPFVREAPAFFTRRGINYLFTSGTTGYFPNPTECADSRLFHGPWDVKGDPCAGDTTKTTFGSQISSVFRHPHKKDLYIAIADRWLVDYDLSLRPLVHNNFIRNFSPVKENLPDDGGINLGKLTEYNTCIAEYLWLPIKFDGDRAYLEYVDEFRIEDYE